LYRRQDVEIPAAVLTISAIAPYVRTSELASIPAPTSTTSYAAGVKTAHDSCRLEHRSAEKQTDMRVKSGSST